MSSGPRRAGSLIAILASLLLGVGALAPAQAATTRTISVSAAPRAAYAGSTVRFSGAVTRSPAGSLVRIQRRAGASWVTVVAARTTSATGSYAVRAALPKKVGTYSYRAVAPAAARLGRATSALIEVSALTRTTATLAASPSVVNPGGSSLFSGKVSPFTPGTTATVQRQVGTTWATVTTVIVGTDGSLSRAVSPTTTTSYRVVVPRVGLAAAATSPIVVITVNQPPAITTTSLPPASQNLPYSRVLARSGKPGTWSLVSGSLPHGLGLSASTGLISGTPTVSGTFPIAVKFTETSTGLSATKGLSLVVGPAPVITTSSPLPDALRNAQYTVTVTRSGGTAGTWTASGLPKGLSIDPSSGVISGVPVELTGTYQATVTFSETGTTRKASTVLSLTITGENPGITTASLADATRATSYSVTLASTGGPGTWSSGTLPGGLKLAPGTGVLSGVPSALVGTYPVTFTFTESGSGFQVSKQLDVHVVGEDPAITSTSLPDATRGASYAATLTKTGGPGSWSAPGLPLGLSLNTSTGAISGTALGHPGSIPVTVTFTESATGIKRTKTLTLAILGEDIGVSTATLPDGTQQTAYSQQLAKTGLAGTWSWAPAGTTSTAPTSTTSLPGGLTLSSDGVISGSPTAGGGDWNVVVTFTETASGYTASRTLYLHVSPQGAATITTASVPNGKVGTPYSVTLSGSSIPTGWTKVDGTLPPGITLNSGGTLSGTPTQAGDYTFIVRYSAVLQLSNTKRFTLHVDPAT